MASLLDNNNNNASRWFDVDVVPEDYKFPHQFRPGNFETETNKQNSLPVIDLSKLDHSSKEKEETIKQILKSCQEFGGFQVINHGFSEEVIKETISVLKGFFSQPVEEKVYEAKENGWVYLRSTDYANDGVHLWRENVKLFPSQPLEDYCMQHLPEKPSKYREVMATYLLGIRSSSTKILEMICEGLGLEADYLKDMNEVQLLSGNNYPPCPDPSLTLGLLKHTDASLITLLYQGNVSGLQVLKDEEWFTVETLPNAFVVNIGNELEIVSNGNLKSLVHRVVTNAEKSRTTIATFITPSPNCIVKPLPTLIDESNPPLFEPSIFKDFVNSRQAFGPLAKAFAK